MKKLVFASHNRGKMREVERILREHLGESAPTLLTLDDIGLTGEIEETGKTFEENALIKAKAAFDHAGIPAFADDSGLSVDALDGAPGIFSARFAAMCGCGEEGDHAANNACLLKKLDGVENRGGGFVCCIAYVSGEETFTVRGECRGEILLSPRGEGGFGYDPLFYMPAFEKTFGELTLDEKNAVSHRGNALEKFAERLKK